MQNVHCGFAAENTVILEVAPNFAGLHRDIIDGSFVMEDGYVLPAGLSRTRHRPDRRNQESISVRARQRRVQQRTGEGPDGLSKLISPCNCSGVSFIQ